MKKIIFAFALMLVVMMGRTQSFEGTLTWSMKTEIKDPKLKKQIEESKKKANDPANQAKIKEMEEKMNDPQFKEMMEKNPQMKAQMEAAMKLMAGGGDMSSIMPTGIVARIKGSNTLTTIQGGMMDKTEVLHLADNDMTYTINNVAMTYVAMDKTDPKIHHHNKIEKTSETQKILGHTCTKYIVKQTPTKDPTNSGPNMNPYSASTTNYWVTTDIKGIDMAALARQQMGREMSFIYSEIEGVPLKIELINDSADITMECTEVKSESLPASIFVLPAGYTETKVQNLFKN